MLPLVTVAIPVYKRLGYLPGALRSVAAQSHPAIELIVSDNGENGEAVNQIVAAHYPRPFTVRHNPRSVPIIAHFNQLIAAATGAYFVLLSDDDELSPSFVAALLALLERHPAATVALARVETFSEDGEHVLASTDDGPPPPELMSGIELLRSWCTYRHKFLSFTTNLARTADLRAVGGYPELDNGNGSDNALLIKQVLGRHVAFSPHATFRHRIHETSFGKAAPIASLALASRQFLRFLAHDPAMQAARQAQPAVYAEARALATMMIYDTYLGRWRGIYRDRLPRGEWLRAGFALPPHPVYTRKVLASIAYALPFVSALTRRVRSKASS